MPHNLHIACVFGNPIEQSKSPVIHKMFAEQFGISLDYQKRLAEADKFAQSAQVFFSNQHVIGANVTMPFKDDALKFADKLSSQAQRAGAVNTLIRENGQLVGDNTDGYGLVTDILNNHVKLDGSSILLIGAGGASKGVVPALADAGIKHIDIYNRSDEKATSLVNYTNTYASDISSVFSKQNIYQYDLIINATSLSLQQSLPQLPDTIFSNNPFVYDMVYLNHPTVFLKHAQSKGCKVCVDGLGMLVNQAARSFELWFDKKPDVQPVLKFLRAQLG